MSQTKITVAVLLAEVAGPAAAGAFGLPTPDQQRGQQQAVVDSINAAGGLGCRQLVPHYFTADIADPSNLQQTCDDILADRVFAVIDTGAYTLYPALAECYPQHQIPYVVSGAFPAAELKRYYPYMFAGATLESIYQDTASGLKAEGFFSGRYGFRKLGVLYATCLPGMAQYYLNQLASEGVSGSDVVTYNVGCPSPFSSPSTLQQAILKFEQAGVTNVTYEQEFLDWSNFTTLAQQQGFHPSYGIPDEQMVAMAISGSTHPDYANIAHTIAITVYRDGEQNSTTQAANNGTAQCNAIMRLHKQPNVYEFDGTSGITCDALWFLVAGVNHASVIERSTLLAGLHTAGSVDLSFPEGPNILTGPDVASGGQYWRPIQFSESCNCFKVIGPFRRGA